MTTQTIPSRPSFLTRKIVWGITLAQVLVVGIMLLSLVLHLINLGAIGDANTYYTAAVKSMLTSWHNFFFVSAEPGGSVTVDKPPLGLWVEAAFALVLGVNGWAVSLPNILAGVASVPLLYFLVRKHMGALAGLVAALVLVVTPVAIATDRNNTMDGMLVFTLLLAAWAFVAATETGKARWLFVGAFMVGLGFNIKMLQAFLPLPAFYALYLLGARTGWRRKVFNVCISALILLVVSLSWAVAVDLTPVDQRPYIGSSEDNTVMELIVGHNGLARLLNPHSGGNAPAQPGVAQNGPVSGSDSSTQKPQPGQSAPQPALDACSNLSVGATCSFQLQNGNTVNGACIQPPAADGLACAPQGALRPQPGNRPQPPVGALGDGPNASPDGQNNAGSTPFSQETGTPGLTRFFTAPLSRQMSWLLPCALVGIGLVIFAVRLRIPLAAEHKALVLWGGWLLTCLVFFSAVEGIFHAYYAIMLAPALGAAVGMGLTQFWRWQAKRRWVNTGLVLAALLTIAFQIYTAAQYGYQSIIAYLPLVVLVVSALLLWVGSLRRVAYVGVLAAMLLIPLLWTGMTVLDKAPNTNLPTSIDTGATRQARPQAVAQLNEPNQANQTLVDYLQANTQDVEYLVAVPDAHTGSALVLATGRPVLYMGGFSGSDPVIDAAGLADMVANGQLRYVLYGSNSNQEIERWLTGSCTIVSQFSQGNQGSAQPQPGQGQTGPNAKPGDQADTLYQCR